MKETKFERRAKRIYAVLSCLLLALTAAVVPAFAAGDPLAALSLSLLVRFCPWLRADVQYKEKRGEVP